MSPTLGVSRGGSKKSLESLLRDSKFLGKAKLSSFDWLFCHALFLLVAFLNYRIALFRSSYFPPVTRSSKDRTTDNKPTITKFLFFLAILMLTFSFHLF